jgi:L-amino acid N-acyltransferase YncA
MSTSSSTAPGHERRTAVTVPVRIRITAGRYLLRQCDVIIRAAGADDAAEIAAIYEPFVLRTVATFESEPPDAAEIVRRMSVRPPLPWLVAEDDGGIVGYAYCSSYRTRPAYRWSVESSVYVRDNRQGQGIGRLLYARLLNEVRGLGYLIVQAGIAMPNEASVALHEAFGFRPVGVHTNIGNKFGSWHDVAWWQLQLADLPEHPAEPRDWAPER